MRTRTSIIGAVVALGICAPSAVAATGNITTVAGTGNAAFSGDGGPAASAELALPTAVIGTSDGGYLISDQVNNRIRKVGPDGIISTLAGPPEIGSAANGLALLPNGNLLVADANANQIKMVTPEGVTTVVVGTGAGTYGGDGGPATAADIRFPTGVTTFPDGSFLIADQDNNRIRRVTGVGGTIDTVVGNGAPNSSGDGFAADDAEISGPSAVLIAPDGGYLITELDGNRIRRVDPAPPNVITTVAGTGSPGYNGDNIPATTAQLNSPQHVAFTSDGGFVIADRVNNRIRKVGTDGFISTLAGDGTGASTGDGGPASASQLNGPFGVGIASDGDLLITDTLSSRIRRVDLGDPPAPPPPDEPNPPASVELGLTSVTRTPGDPNAVTAIVKRVRGSLAAGVEVRYAITGSNPSTGRKTTDVNGAVTIDWEGVRDGTDTIAVWLDQNGNGRQDTGEPFDSATVNWVLPVPEIRKTVNIEPVSGTVLVKLPAGANVNKRDPWAVAAQNGFIPLEQAKNVPINTIVNADRGRIELASAINKSSEKTQTGQFYSGQFQIRQTSGARPFTELRMNATLTCPKSTKKVDASGRTRRTRALWGKAKGRFRTRGRHSSASVRGTTWYSKDTCTSTTTVVREGSVVVNDFAKGKNVTVKAPKRYVARAKKKKKIKSRSG